MIKEISVIGLGKLGFPIASVLRKKYKVIGIDKKSNYSFNKLGDISFVIVPTPSINNKFTSKYIEEVLNEIEKDSHIVVIVSTVMPTECDRLQHKYPNLVLVYNPTFVALGSVIQDFTNPDFVLIGGENLDAIHKVMSIHKQICNNVPKFSLMSFLEAEIAKLSLNCYVTTKITFANQIGHLCHIIGIKPDTILSAIGQDRRIGNEYFKAGLGYGGPCFPRDNRAMSSFMEENFKDPALFDLIHALNEKIPDIIVERIKRRNPESIGFSGISYKKGSNVNEQSQLNKIYQSLKEEGYKVMIGKKGEINLDWNGICE
jgi:UDPglucose 6-dehydrogenase